jgi:hypothetical protein
MAEGGYSIETQKTEQKTAEQKEMANKEENEDVAMQRLLGQMKRYSTSSSWTWWNHRGSQLYFHITRYVFFF